MERRIKIEAIIRRLAQRPVAPSAEESLFESGVLDSFMLVDVVSALEEEFSIQIPDADLSPRAFDTITRIEAYLQSRS